MRFLQELHPVFDGVFISLAHAFSLSDSHPLILPFYKLEKSKFVDERTIALVEYAREYFQKKDHDLNSGISLVSNFMRNFGIAFEDSPNGLICHVDYSDF